VTVSDLSISQLVRQHGGRQFDLHERYLNNQMVRVLRTLDFDRNYVRAQGAHLYDDQGREYLDLLSGWGVFAVGHNHPVVAAALQEVLRDELPSLIQMDVSLLAGILAERLVETLPPGLDKVVFANSGTEAVEAAIKFARYKTQRPGIVYCDHAFHGVTLGSLSLNGDAIFREGFGPLLPDAHAIRDVAGLRLRSPLPVGVEPAPLQRPAAKARARSREPRERIAYFMVSHKPCRD